MKNLHKYRYVCIYIHTCKYMIWYIYDKVLCINISHVNFITFDMLPNALKNNLHDAHM